MKSRHGLRPALRHVTDRERYAAPLERPAPRSFLASRTAWAFAIAAWLLVWLIVRAVRAFWSWA